MGLTSQGRTVIRGDSATLAISLADPDTGAAFDPTGHVLTFTAKYRKADRSAAIEKDSDDGLTVTDAAAGRIALELAPADTNCIPAYSFLVFDVQAQHLTTGAVKTVALGGLKISADVTRG